LLFWLLLAVFAVANGAVRGALMAPLMPELCAHQLSTATGAAGVFLITLALIKRLGAKRPAHYWLAGVQWVVMTVAFEFLFGRLAMGHSRERLLHDYNLVEGRVWPLFLAALLVSPRLCAGLRRLEGKEDDST